MNMQQNIRQGGSAEIYEQLSVFLPASVIRALRDQVPPGQRRAFIARALQQALQQEEEKLLRD